MRLFSAVAWFRSLANLSINLSAGWYGTIIVIPVWISRPDWLLLLTVNTFLGTLFLLLSVFLEALLLDNE